MAEITKITTPMMPKENIGNKFKPVSDQAFELTNPDKVHKAGEDNKVGNRQAGNQTQNLGRSMLQPLFRSTMDLMQAVHKMTVLVQMGISTSDIVNDPQVRELLESLFITPEQLMAAVKEQDQSSVLFKGEAFDVLRDIMAKFENNPKVKDAISQLIKTFEQNVNAQNSVKTILHNCENILDYMFTKDREQFSSYLKGLNEMLLEGEQPGQEAAVPGKEAVPGDPAAAAQAKEAGTAGQTGALSIDQKEAAQVLKGNLLPLLGEIVVKYHQNERIRDIVMVVVHNIVRVDQGTPEALREAVGKLVHELRQVANLPESFEQGLLEALKQGGDKVRGAQNDVLSKLSDIISETLRTPTSNPAVLRQAETLMMSMLQNQSSMMDLLHFVLPMQMPDGQVFAEMYVDPDSEEHGDRPGANSRKIFLSVESENHGTFELSFLQTEERVDFAMWCPQVLVSNLTAHKRQFADLMAVHGYTMHSFEVSELVRPHSIADVFPKLLKKKVGIDVRI